MKEVEQWGVFELRFQGFTDGNPFVDYTIHGLFQSEVERVEVPGFYDGNGEYVIRFMPSYVGKYQYRVDGTFSSQAYEGFFVVTAPGKTNHGPVRVHNTYHFAHADGTPYQPVGTTCYAWTHQPAFLQEQTLETLRTGPFNKLRFCLLPKSYRYNCKDPQLFPYEGHSCDASGMNRYTYDSYTPQTPGNQWDFFRFNPAFFQATELRIRQLMDLGIEADLIVMHPYDRWGFSQMPPAADDLYWKYVLARFSAFRNIWWSLSNEYDLFPEETHKDWEYFAQLIEKYDPYRHLRSIHNGPQFYDYTRPWITHACIQRRDFTNDLDDIPKFRATYQKPIVFDEMHYEGNIEENWGNITGEELVRRCWICAIYGAYSTHGETYDDPDEVIWWSHGGTLHGTSAARIGFLKQVLKDVPGGCGLRPYEAQCAVPDMPDGEDCFRLYYYGVHRPKGKTNTLPKDTVWRVEILDTWDMTLTDAGLHSGQFEIPLPGKPYLAVRLSAEPNKQTAK